MPSVHGMRIAFFGSSIVSAYWNGAATYYRGLLKAMARRGHRITFYEPDAFGRQQHRDLIENPDYCEVVVYPAAGDGDALRALESARDADVIVKASGIGVFDALLERAVPEFCSSRQTALFWDVDAPATLDRLCNDRSDPFHIALPRYDAVFTYGGGPPVVAAYEKLGARSCLPIYNALDPDTHFPVHADPAFIADTAFLGNRLPDREQRVHEFFFRPARHLSAKRFILGGSGWDDVVKRHPNVRYLRHVYTSQHNAFYSSPRTVLSINRESMARYGYSPATRIFEAAGAAACIITDQWAGLGMFLEPGRECIAVETGEEAAERIASIGEREAAEIGEAGHRRILAEHTYTRRAEIVERFLGAKPALAGSTGVLG